MRVRSLFLTLGFLFMGGSLLFAGKTDDVVRDAQGFAQPAPKDGAREEKPLLVKYQNVSSTQEFSQRDQPSSSDDASEWDDWDEWNT